MVAFRPYTGIYKMTVGADIIRPHTDIIRPYTDIIRPKRHYNKRKERTDFCAFFFVEWCFIKIYEWSTLLN